MRDRLAGSGVPVQIGYPRRFDPAFVAARDAVRAGELGRVHTVRSTTLDPAPPPAAYLAGSGGIFRDCSVHDFDAVRWVTGREAVSVYAVGAVDPDAGREFYADNGDYSTASVLHHPRRRLDRRGVEHPHQRPRLRRAPRGARRRRTPSPPASTRACRCARPSRASPGPPARRTPSSWTA